MKNLLPDIRDVHVYGGIALAGYGISLYSLALALIFGGLMLIHIGLK